MRTIRVPWVIRMVTVAASAVDQRTTVRSAVPSPFGEKAGGVALSTAIGAVPSTTTSQARAWLLPASSKTASVSR